MFQWLLCFCAFSCFFIRKNFLRFASALEVFGFDDEETASPSCSLDFNVGSGSDSDVTLPTTVARISAGRFFGAGQVRFSVASMQTPACFLHGGRFASGMRSSSSTSSLLLLSTESMVLSPSCPPADIHSAIFSGIGLGWPTSEFSGIAHRLLVAILRETTP